MIPFDIFNIGKLFQLPFPVSSKYLYWVSNSTFVTAGAGAGAVGTAGAASGAAGVGGFGSGFARGFGTGGGRPCLSIAAASASSGGNFVSDCNLIQNRKNANIYQMRIADSIEITFL